MTPTALHLFCGLGGGGLGFRRAGFRGVGAFDVSPEACRDYETLVGEPATVADLGSISPAELRAACTGAPDVVFTSPPCKGFSGCLPTARSESTTYQAMNSLAFRGIWLALEAWPERPPRLILLENVPRIQSRGRGWLDDVHKLLVAYGYVVSETTHDCGELGGLAQSRRRFLLVARHAASVPEVLYEPPLRPLRTIGDVLGELPVPLPGSDAGGPMHRLPRLSAMNWLRLALIPSGGDWRDLPESVALAARSGRQNGGYGVEGWDGRSHAVLAEGSVRNTRASVADPRVTCKRREGSLGVTSWSSPSVTVIANGTHHNGPWQCADPRLELLALQGFPTEASGRWLVLDGRSHRSWRQRIGNAVPPPAAEAIARSMMRTLVAAEGETFLMGSTPIWVEPTAEVSP